MGRPLPLDREKALEAIANGWGRTATAAHPDCTCNRHPFDSHAEREGRRTCPMHGKDPQPKERPT